MRVVVCDDDAVLRSVVTTLAEQAGHEVLAETDSGADAVAMIDRFGAELLVLDLSLPGMSGYDVLVEVRRRELDCDVIVFTAFDADADAILAAGARALVMKPDLAALVAALSVVPANHLPGGRERRRVDPRDDRLRRPTVAEVGPSGVAPPALVEEWVGTLRTGDAVLAVAVDHPDGRPPTAWGRLRSADRLLAAARTAHRVLRAQDRLGLHEPEVALAGDDGLLVCLLLGGGRAGPPASFARLVSAHLGVDPCASLRGGWVAIGEGDDAENGDPSRRRRSQRRRHRPAGGAPAVRRVARVVARRPPVVDCRAVVCAPVPGIVSDAGAHRRRAWIEQRLFEVLGGWVATTDDPEARIALATACRRHEWHARLWRDLVPVLGGHIVDEREVAPPPAWVALLDAVAAAPTTVERLTGFVRVVLAQLITTDDARLAVASPVADAPLRRVLELVLADDIDEWRTGEARLRRLVVDRSTVDAAAAHQARIEHLLLDARTSA